MFIILGQLVILTGCPSSNLETEKQVWQYGTFSYFDTVSYIYSYKGDEQAEFQENCKQAAELLGTYHKLFDIYYEYSGINNLYTINKNAGKEAFFSVALRKMPQN